MQATKSGPGHRRPRRTSGARIALGTLTAVLVVLVLGGYGLVQTGEAAQSAAAQVLAMINQARAQAGLPAYTLISGLGTSSRAHTLQMADGCGLSHQCPGEPALPDRLTQAG